MTVEDRTAVFIEGIGPPLSQLLDDYADSELPEQVRFDVIALVKEVKRLRDALEEVAAYSRETRKRAWVPAEIAKRALKEPT